MRMDTNLLGRLRNTSLPASSGLMPLFEAVVNSIHAIEEAAVGMSKGRITITILRGTPQTLSFKEDSDSDNTAIKEPIVGFRITDNGIGMERSLAMKKETTGRLSRALGITQRRIALFRQFYKEPRYTMSIQSRNQENEGEEGVIVEIILPVRKIDAASS